MTVTDQEPTTRPVYRSVSETLRAALAKIPTPDKWCKRNLAKISRYSKHDVSPDAPYAGAWCALGAIEAVDGPFETNAIETLAGVCQERNPRRLGYYSREPGPSDITSYNDSPFTRHRDIVRAYRQAIARAEKAENS